MKKKKNEVAPELEFRRSILSLARKLKCEVEVKQIFNRYDGLLANCSNEKERKAIAIMGIAELHKFLDCQGALVVNGEEIIPAKKEDLSIIKT